LLNDGDPHFQLSACSDGKHLVYDSWNNASPSLWRSDADGSNAVKFPVQIALQGGVCSVDSKSALYRQENMMWRIPMDGGTPVKLNAPATQGPVLFSPDGKLVAYGNQSLQGGTLRSQMIVAPSEGGPPLHTFDAPYGARSARFTPDSKAIAFLMTR